MRIGHGGKTVYGARVGILMLDTKWPRPPGRHGQRAHVAVSGALQGRERRDRARRRARAGQRSRAGVSRSGGGAREGRRRRHHDDRRLSRDFPEAARGARERAGRELVAHADSARAEPAAAGQARRRAVGARRPHHARALGRGRRAARHAGHGHRERHRVHARHAERRDRARLRAAEREIVGAGEELLRSTRTSARSSARTTTWRRTRRR